jgi:hypothetical protein
MAEPIFKKLLDNATEQLTMVTGFPLSSITSVKKEGESWVLNVELLEKKGIPDRMDILGEYRVRVSGQGGMEGYERVSLRKRGDTGEQVSEEA